MNRLTLWLGLFCAVCLSCENVHGQCAYGLRRVGWSPTPGGTFIYWGPHYVSQIPRWWDTAWPNPVPFGRSYPFGPPPCAIAPPLGFVPVICQAGPNVPGVVEEVSPPQLPEDAGAAPNQAPETVVPLENGPDGTPPSTPRLDRPGETDGAPAPPQPKKAKPKKPDTRKQIINATAFEIRNAEGRLVAEGKLSGAAARVKLSPGRYVLQRVAPGAQPLEIELRPGQRFKLDLEPDGRLAVWTQRDSKDEEFVQGR